MIFSHPLVWLLFLCLHLVCMEAWNCRQRYHYQEGLSYKPFPVFGGALSCIARRTNTSSTTLDSSLATYNSVEEQLLQSSSRSRKWSVLLETAPKRLEQRTWIPALNWPSHVLGCCKNSSRTSFSVSMQAHECRHLASPAS